MTDAATGRTSPKGERIYAQLLGEPDREFHEQEVAVELVVNSFQKHIFLRQRRAEVQLLVDRIIDAMKSAAALRART